MESTAQYWKPVWGTLEQYWKPTGQNEKVDKEMATLLSQHQAAVERLAEVPGLGGPAVNAKLRRRRTNRMIRELRSLGYRVEAVGTPA